MRRTRRTRSSARPIGRLLALLAALAALFAMHGLSDHGAPDVVAASTAHAPVPMAHTEVVDTGHGEAVDVSPAPGHGHDTGLMGLCLAVLVAALVLLTVVRRWSTRPLAAWLPAAHLGLLGFARERVPRPPDLHALSIQRC